MGRVGGKVAFITGAARGQGREHAVRLAEEGAKIIAIDICRDIPTAPYGGATPDDLAQTVKRVEAIGGEILSRQVDVRDAAALDNVVAEGIQAFGAIDIVSVNAGIAGYSQALDISDEVWQEMIDINLTGAWKTVRSATRPMVERGRGGSLILTASVAGLIAFPNLAHYSRQTRHRRTNESSRGRACAAPDPGKCGVPQPG